MQFSSLQACNTREDVIVQGKEIQSNTNISSVHTEPLQFKINFRNPQRFTRDPNNEYSNLTISQGKR